MQAVDCNNMMSRIECPCRLEIGTTYNSYLIFGEEKTALVDAAHEKFGSLYLDTLKVRMPHLFRSACACGSCELSEAAPN